MKHKILLIGLFLGGLLFIGNKLQKNNNKTSGHLGHQAEIDREPAGTYEQSHVQNSIHKDVYKELSSDHKSYFDNNISQNIKAKEFFEKTKNILGNSQDSSLIAEYVAEGLMRKDGPEFADYYVSLMRDLDNGNQQVYHLILEKESILQKDKYIYQMILNMTASMSLPISQKARILGGALQMPIQFSGSGISFESTNVTNALIHLKNSDIPEKLIFNYLQIGLDANKENRNSLKEFQARAHAYFPQMVDQVR